MNTVYPSVMSNGSNIMHKIEFDDGDVETLNSRQKYGVTKGRYIFLLLSFLAYKNLKEIFKLMFNSFFNFLERNIF